MKICGVYDFCFNDLLCPDKNRMIIYFSAIINYIRFREDKIPEYDNLTTEIVSSSPF